MREGGRCVPSALAGLEALLRLVDDVNAALAADELVVAVTSSQGFQRVANLHRSGLRAAWSDNRTGLSGKGNRTQRRVHGENPARGVIRARHIIRPATSRNRNPCPAAVLILVDGGEAEGPHRLGKGLGG